MNKSEIIKLSNLFNEYGIQNFYHGAYGEKIYEQRCAKIKKTFINLACKIIKEL